MRLLGREAESEVLDRLLTDVRAGESRVLVLRGPAGVGKTALLGYVTEHVEDFRLARAAGVESEKELAYSGLHQLCAPLLGHLERLPVPQRNALATVFGLGEGAAPNRFLVGLATLTLFAEVGEQRPLVCIVDDAQWLDQASAQTLGFVGRRLLAERVALVCAARRGIGDTALAGLPELSVDELGESDALALLLENLHGPLDATVCQRIVADSHGNPLALLELPRTWSVEELAGGFGLPEGRPVASRIEESYARRLLELPSDTRLIVLAAAAEPLGDPILLHSAAETLEIDMAAVGSAEDAGLLKVGGRVEFAHPLVRTATYRSASTNDRLRVHRALASATDAETDPDRRAWHRAQASLGPNEEVAVELERSADRAQARGGLAAAAAFLERAFELTRDPTRRAERALSAAEASFQAGAFDVALALVETAEAEVVNEAQGGRIDLLRGQLAFASANADAPTLLLRAAKRLETLEPKVARETYLTAWRAANMAGDGGVAVDVCHAVRALPRASSGPIPLDTLLDAVASLTIDGRAAAAPKLKQAAKILAEISAEDVVRWGSAGAATAASWDVEGWRRLNERHVQLMRDVGALAQLPLRLMSAGIADAWVGDFAGAASAIAESESVVAETGGRIGPYALLRLRALQGREVETSPLIADALEQGSTGAQGMVAIHAHWAAAVLYNGLGHYDEAAAAARPATSNTFEPWVSMWGLPELVEAASRSGDEGSAREAFERLRETTQSSGGDVALGIEARCLALLSEGGAAEHEYREAIDRLGHTAVRPELARAHLLFGEWLRREGRRVDAREQLRTAYDMFVAIGMEAFAERARRELVATGERVRKRTPETRDELTPQEEQIARLARDGLSNPEIGARLFISARTVEWHLRKVFTKLGITSRRQLRTTDDSRLVERT